MFPRKYYSGQIGYTMYGNSENQNDIHILYYLAHGIGEIG